LINTAGIHASSLIELEDGVKLRGPSWCHIAFENHRCFDKVCRVLFFEEVSSAD